MQRSCTMGPPTRGPTARARSRASVAALAGLRPAPRVLVLVGAEDLAVEVVGARAGDGGDDRRPASSYSALKFGVRTRNSCTASCGKGLPRLTSWPTMPPWLTLLFRLTPSMKTLTCGPPKLSPLRLTPTPAPPSLAELGLQHADARRERREIEEVAVVLRQVLDLVGGDVGADLGGARLAEPGADDENRRRRRRSRGRVFGRGGVEVERRGLADRDDHPLRVPRPAGSATRMS